VRVTVLDGQNRKLKGVRVRLTGAGIRAVAKLTNGLGQVSFKVKPRKKGKLAVSATKAGFQPAYGSVKVR
jgi:hypothetical protein